MSEKEPRPNRPFKKKGPFKKKRTSAKQKEQSHTEELRLNKYVARSGICSRREADQLIANGEIKVNGSVITELGVKVKWKDKVEYAGKRLNPETFRYILLNKPKDHITSTKDDKGRKTVMHLIRHACTERIYPVGQLDRNTTGVLLFTNDGPLAKKLTHPLNGAEKLYHVVLDKAVSKAHLIQLVEGVDLEDGMATATEASFVGKKRKEVGVRVHMGKNRIVRRMFAHLGYTVEKLDRVLFAGLSKKELERGKWRHLTEKEVGFLLRKR